MVCLLCYLLFHKIKNPWTVATSGPPEKPADKSPVAHR